MKPLTFRRACNIAWRARRQVVSAVMLPVFIFSLIPSSAWADTSDDNSPKPVLTPTNVHVNKRAPKVSPYSGVQLSATPSDAEITYSHTFSQPLLPVGGTTTPAENAALSTAIKAYLARKAKEDVSALTDFFGQYPDSAWRPSLDLNIAEALYKTGNFSKALDTWSDAWGRTQNLTDAAGLSIGNLAVGNLAEMKARIGRTDELDALFKQIKGRNVTGSAAQLLVQARAGLWLMQNRPQDAFRCGPSALQELSMATKHKIEHANLIKQSRSTPHGIALSDVQALAAKINMPMQMAKRTEESAPFLVPSVIHWKLGHYAALVGEHDGQYIIHDTTFGGAQFLVTAKALQQETSGYFLVPAGALPKGWKSVSKKEGMQVFGRGNPGNSDPTCYSPIDGNVGDGDCGTGGTGPSTFDPNGTGGSSANDPDAIPRGGPWIGMTVSYVKAMLVSLTLMDNPVQYAPPIGPSMHFTVHYNQREIAQPAIFAYSNLGPNWTYSYISYVTPNGVTATVYERGGGEELYSYDYNSNAYFPAQKSQAVLASVNSTTWTRTLPSGEVETFGVPDGAGNFFLSEITDPNGNSLTLSYDSHFRLVSLTDAIGQVTTLTYVSNVFGDSKYYNISKVTDPFGRFAQFNYDTSGRLQQITDVIGITSQFAYSGATTFVKSLTTPYGTTSFAFGDNSTDPTLGTTKWEETTYPDGNRTRTEYNDDFNGAIPIASADPNGVPSGMYSGSEYPGSSQNIYMQYRNTFYWDKQAMHDYPNDYTHAEITHWMHTADINTCSGIEESIKKVNQNRIWYAYGDPVGSGEISSIQASNSMIDKPTQRGRVIGSGTASSANSQVFSYEYNAIGNVTKEVDPAGRETDYTYYPNNTDLYQVQQKNGSGYDLLATFTYNGQHEILTATDAAGQVTHYNYYANGQVHTITNAKSQVSTYNYTNIYLTSVTGPVAGSTTSYSYDGYGRIRTATDSQGYAVTTDYDAMDRPTQVTYPDSTTTQAHYSNLDLQYTRDRLGRLTRFFYNSLRQPIETVDAQGHIVSTYWTLSAGISSIVDPNGNVTSWKYDAQNRPVEKDYPNSTKQRTAYESTTSRVLSVTDNIGQVATCSYNMDNTVQNVTYTNATVATPTVNYTYDPVYPRLATVGDSATGTITYNYNSVNGGIGSNLLASIQMPLATISYSSSGTPLYDELGRLLGQSVNDSATGQGLSDNLSTVVYDSLGRTQTASNPLSGGGSFSYSYLNQSGRVTSIANPNGQKVVYTYQDSSTTPNEPRLTEIKNLNASSNVISKFDYGYDASNQITSWTQQTDSNDPQNWAMQYDKEGKLSSVNITDTVTSAVLHQYAYLYDAAGNRTSEQIDGTATASSYNSLNQLTGQSANAQMVFSGNTGTEPATVTVNGSAATTAYSTNFVGVANVTSGTNTITVAATDVNGNTTTHHYQVTESATNATYGYDLNGNLTSDGSRTYGWDAKDQLVSIIYNSGANAGNHTEFTYNAVGDRIKVVERTGTSIGSGTITSTKQYVGGEERDANNHVTKRYFSQGEQRISGSTATNYFYTYDHLGSIREVMANDGSTIAARYSYDPYGRATQVSGSFACDFQYAGMYEHAVSGLNLTPNRAYNPNLGRWISRDPVGENAGLNLYAYSDNSPICESDPSGLDPDGPNLPPLHIVINPEPIPDPVDPTPDDPTPPVPDPPTEPWNKCMDDSPLSSGDGGGGWLDNLQIGLTGLGFIPGLGEVTNALSAIVSLTQGDYTGAALSAVALIPIVGEGADVAKEARLVEGVAVRGGESAATAAGRAAHRAYNPGKGYVKEFTLASGKRVDAINFATRTVRELKPNNPRAIARGRRQVARYVEELEAQYGGTWTGVVDTY